MKTSKIIFFITVFIIFASCNYVKEQYSDGDANKEQQPSKSLDKLSTPIEKVKKTLIADFDKDGTKDSLILAVDADLDDQDRIVWDDANSWRLYIKYNNFFKRIYKEEIQLGRVDLYYSHKEELMYLVENAPYQKRVFQIAPKEDFAVVEIDKLPPNKNFELLSIQ